ncbi:MAG: hypothetical protein ABSG32_31385 [Terriglobia bacterium]|jgi:hypothetical protein
MSLGFAAFLVAAFSTTVVALLSCVKRPSGKFWFLVAALVVPFTLANGLYWSEAWRSADPYAFGDYEMWAPMFLVPWFLAGAIPSVAVVLFIRRAAPSAQQDRAKGEPPQT